MIELDTISPEYLAFPPATESPFPNWGERIGQGSANESTFKNKAEKQPNNCWHLFGAECGFCFVFFVYFLEDMLLCYLLLETTLEPTFVIEHRL